jgi:hypothetical protein
VNSSPAHDGQRRWAPPLEALLRLGEHSLGPHVAQELRAERAQLLGDAVDQRQARHRAALAVERLNEREVAGGEDQRDRIRVGIRVHGRLDLLGRRRELLAREQLAKRRLVGRRVADHATTIVQAVGAAASSSGAPVVRTATAACRCALALAPLAHLLGDELQTVGRRQCSKAVRAQRGE